MDVTLLERLIQMTETVVIFLPNLERQGSVLMMLDLVLLGFHLVLDCKLVIPFNRILHIFIHSQLGASIHWLFCACVRWITFRLTKILGFQDYFVGIRHLSI